MRPLRQAITGVVLSALLAVSGCGFTGVNSIPLPLSKGGGSDATTVTIYLADAANLVANSEVRFDEVVVGSVRSIVFDGWKAKLTVGLESDARVPADATAKIGQKSLLGAEYLELSAPSNADEAFLAKGDVIDLDRTGRYPETEEVLAGAAMLLNNGGLPQVRTITRELNNTLGGREDVVRSYVSELRTFVRTLDDQRENIIATLAELDAFAKTVSKRSDIVDQALVDLPDGVRTLAAEREDLVAALRAIGKLGDTTHRVVTTVEEDLRANLRSLTPITKAVVDGGTSTGRAFNALTLPFSVSGANKIFRGDYANLFATFNLSVPELDRFFLGGTPLDGLFTGLLGSVPTGVIDDAEDPLAGFKAQGGEAGKILGDLADKPNSRRDSPGTASTPKPAPKGLLDTLLGGS
ncbi:MCE family protein [Aeromicrobium sp.]|uniref:MCE family protein n=1 Tax=Aeromicrobium sp. TaxID=1871063 RepID=UPI0030C0AC4D